jgi:hypothetical protein
MLESENEHKEQGVSILFKKKIDDGEYVYRQLLFNGNGSSTYQMNFRKG